ncbi:hypothetical protein WNY61_03305 [Sulfitobacter sp. AS92]|uniref:hypothetical protein n=1 Tax=Sulfitobacter sp. AS92 TaxID=3135783 RepID=UPI003174E889
MKTNTYNVAKASFILGEHKPEGATVELSPAQAAPFIRGEQITAVKSAQKKAKD